MGSPFLCVRAYFRGLNMKRRLRLRAYFGLLLLLGVAAGSWPQQWQRLGPVGGLVVSLSTGVSGAIYLGTADGHIFVSEDRASHWELRGRVGVRLDAVVTRVVPDLRDGKRAFASVWYRESAEDGGVFRSDDGARSWHPAGLQGEAVRTLERSPSDPDQLIAGTRSGVFRSKDSGLTWQRISPEGDPELRNLDSLAIDPRNPNVIYAGTYHLPWRTKDGGKSWEPVVTGIIDDSDIMSLSLDSSDPERIYMSACSGIYRSENQGESWTKLQGIPYAARRTQVLVQDPDSPKTVYAGTTEGGWVTRDGGETWGRTTPKDWVVNAIVVVPGKGEEADRLVIGTEKGIEVSEDGGASFAASNEGFRHMVVKNLISSASGGGKLLAVVEHGGREVLQSTDQGNKWSALSLVTGGAGKQEKTLVVNQIDQVYGGPWGWILGMVDGNLWISDGKTAVLRPWRPRVAAESPPSGAKGGAQKPTTRAVSVDPGGRSLVLASDFAFVASQQGILRCDEAGKCTRLKTFGGPGAFAGLWASRSGEQLLVLRDGKVGRSVDGGKTAVWGELPGGIARPLWVDAAEVGAQGVIVLGTSEGLFLSSDEGAHWKRSGGGLPTGSTEVFASEGGLWVVAERSGGIYFSKDQGQTWSRADRESERGRIGGMAFVEAGTLRIGSQSEGILGLSLK